MTGIFAGVVIVVLLAIWVLLPLRGAGTSREMAASSPSAHRLENLLFEREAALLAIRDVRLDYEMGKLSDTDFADLDSRYRAHAVEILKELDSLGVAEPEVEPLDASLDAWIERAVAEARQGARPLAVDGAVEA